MRFGQRSWPFASRRERTCRPPRAPGQRQADRPTGQSRQSVNRRGGRQDRELGHVRVGHLAACASQRRKQRAVQLDQPRWQRCRVPKVDDHGGGARHAGAQLVEPRRMPACSQHVVAAVGRGPHHGDADTAARSGHQHCPRHRSIVPHRLLNGRRRSVPDYGELDTRSSSSASWSTASWTRASSWWSRSAGTRGAFFRIEAKSLVGTPLG